MWGLEEETVTAILGEGWGGSDGKEGGVDPGEALCIKQRLLKLCFSSVRVWQIGRNADKRQAKTKIGR